jgi:hypothetical protein
LAWNIPSSVSSPHAADGKPPESLRNLQRQFAAGASASHQDRRFPLICTVWIEIGNLAGLVRWLEPRTPSQRFPACPETSLTCPTAGIMLRIKLDTTVLLLGTTALVPCFAMQIKQCCSFRKSVASRQTLDVTLSQSQTKNVTYIAPWPLSDTYDTTLHPTPSHRHATVDVQACRKARTRRESKESRDSIHPVAVLRIVRCCTCNCLVSAD